MKPIESCQSLQTVYTIEINLYKKYKKIKFGYKIMYTIMCIISGEWNNLLYIYKYKVHFKNPWLHSISCNVGKGYHIQIWLCLSASTWQEVAWHEFRWQKSVNWGWNSVITTDQSQSSLSVAGVMECTFHFVAFVMLYILILNLN